MPIGVLALLLSFSSCDSDGLTSTAEPANFSSLHQDPQKYDEYQPKVLAGEVFEFASPIFLTVGKGDPFSRGGNKVKISIRGQADSYMFKYGSWMVTLDLIHNTETGETFGTYTCIFPDMGDEVTFSVWDDNGPVESGDLAGTPLYTISMDAQILRGTGRFINMGMQDDGKVILSDVLNILRPGSPDISSYCKVSGTMFEIQ